MTVAAPDILALTRDARLAPLAMHAIPAWLWAADGARVLWANATGAAALAALNVAALRERTFTTDEPLGADIARLVATLPPTSAKYERLRDVGTSLVCACSRVEVAGVAGILVTASEPGRTLPLAERASRLFGASSEALAAFTPDGALLYTNANLEGGTTLAALGVKTEKLGSGGNAVLLAMLPPERAEAPQEQASEQVDEVKALEEESSSPSVEEPGAPRIIEEIPAAVPADEPEEKVAAHSPAPERPLRFVWTMDAQEHFHLAAQAFADAMGPRTAEVIGKPWREIAATLGLDTEARIANAVAARDTFSGIVVAWPAASGGTVSVELSGLPIFDRERSFRGYRGFGVCRTTPSAPVQTEAPPPAPAEPAHQPAKEPERPLLTVVPASPNVVPFPGGPEKRPALTPVERSAFVEIGEKLKNGTPAAAPVPPAEPDEPAEALTSQPAATDLMPSAFATPPANATAAQKNAEAQLAVLERLPVGVLIHRNDALLYANRAFLEWTGYADITAVAQADGLERLVVDPQAGALDRLNGTGKTFTIATRTGDTLTCEGRLYSVPWQGESALMLALIRTAEAARLRDAEITLRAAEAEIRELRSILDTATDGIVVVDREGLILTLNRPAEALFGYEYHEIARRPFTELFAPESERLARDYLDGLLTNGVASALNAGREVIGRVRQGGLIPLFMTMGRIGEGKKFCAVLRDITQWKRAEEDLINARRTAERASSAKSDFLAKISHEIRTPLNAVLGFSEVILNEQFGALGNDRYREYMRDIHVSGEHLVSLINDLLDLSKIEAGKLDLVFASVNLNELVRGCVALMQPQANGSRIIIRSSLSPSLPAVMADARSVRQIVLNLLSNSIKFTGAGGQVIVSTAATERGEAILRVRDTGAGMTEKEIETAMEPFRQLATSTRHGSGGTGLGLPLTKALAEANRASFAIKSAKDAGTLVEVVFPRG